MTTRTQIEKFWHLASAGKSAALDIHTQTGELQARFTRSANGAAGNGAPPATMGDVWARVVACADGIITRGEER